MSVSSQNNVVTVLHPVQGVKEDAEAITAELLQKCSDLCQLYDTIFIYHDASQLEKANEEYAKIFAQTFAQMECKVKMCAAIPRALVRVLAKFAIAVSNRDIQIFKSEEQAQEWLFTQPEFVPNLSKMPLGAKNFAA